MVAGTLVKAIAKVVSSKGMREAIKEFGAKAVKSVYKDPGMKKAKEISKSIKAGERYRKTKLPRSKGVKDTADQAAKSKRDTSFKKYKRNVQKRKNEIDRGEIPDRMSTLGRRGYNFSRGGAVAGRAALRGYGKAKK
tara:strand:- start:629 stop:1039 length:411 start_codon:yes stop_codon:yes gene_type:complete